MAVHQKRSATRFVARASTVSAMSAVACLESPTAPDPFDFNKFLNPINGVHVYAGSHFEYAEVDDTIGIYAWGYHNGEGIGTQRVTTAAWTPSDPSALQIVHFTNVGNGSREH